MPLEFICRYSFFRKNIYLESMRTLLPQFIYTLLSIVALCSCSTEQEPDNYDTDTYSISFSGDIESFQASYAIYHTSSDAFLYNSNQQIVNDFLSESLPIEESFSFKYKLDNRPRYILFSCTALCLTNEKQKKIEGSIIRKHNGEIIDKAVFEIKSFSTVERPKLEDYSFKIKI